MKKSLIQVSRGLEPADMVLKNGMVLNVFTEELICADVAVVDGMIAGVGTYRGELEVDCTGRYLVPGLIDGHMHIESTMVTPPELAYCVAGQGTTTLIADPHEIVNVAGAGGMKYMLDATEQLPVNVFFMLPSCVPAADIDTNGAGKFLASDMKPFLQHSRVLGLGEVMRFGDVLTEQPEIMEKLELFRNETVDGHAPGIAGNDVQAYRAAGVCNDHECTTKEEVLDKLRAGFYILIREGSAARNLETLVQAVLEEHMPFERCLFCTDDKHLEEIEKEGHINYCVRKAIAMGVPAVKAYKMASYYTAKAFGLKKLGAIGAGYQADILVMDDLESVKPELIFQKGRQVSAENGENWHCGLVAPSLLGSVICESLTGEKLRLKVEGPMHVMEMVPKQLLTLHRYENIPEKDGFFAPNAEYGKLCVTERHGRTGRTAVCPLKGYGIVGGAVATSVSHDAHNIIAAGDNDEDIIAAVEELRRIQGGYAIASHGKVLNSLPLQVAGLMSCFTAEEVKKKVQKMEEQARALGVREGIEPFITLSFMALTVIPQIRLTEAGLYDAEKGSFL